MIKKLLAATSVAAILVGGANAQLALKQAPVASPGTVNSTVAAPYILADEVDFAVLNATGYGPGIGQFGLVVSTEGIIPPGQNLFLTIQVTNGTIAANLLGSEFGAGVTGAVVNSGGTVGATNVRYLITTDGTDTSVLGGNFATKDGVSINLPIRASS